MLVCGNTVVSVKEALAAAPNVRAARVITLRAGSRDADGRTLPEVVLAARFTREALGDVRWLNVSSVQVVTEVASEVLFDQQGPCGSVRPLDLTGEPGIAAIVAAIDFAEPAWARPLPTPVHRPTVSRPVREALVAFTRAIETAAPEQFQLLAPGLSVDEISEGMSGLTSSPPDELVALYQWSNGYVPGPSPWLPLFLGWWPIPLEHGIERRERFNASTEESIR